MTSLSLSILHGPEHGMIGQYHAKLPEVKVGRATSCDWVLPDPRQTLSRTHCRLELVAGTWQVRDLSANGTFINSASEPIGNECLHPLRHGDRLRIGEYEIEVNLHHDTAPRDEPFEGAPRAGGFAGVRLPGLDDPLPEPRGYPRNEDRLLSSNASSLGTLSDHSPAITDAFGTMPAVLPSGDLATAPDDWYRSMLLPSGRPAAPPRPPPPIAEPVPPPTREVPVRPEGIVSPGVGLAAPQAPGRDGLVAFRLLLQGAGLPADSLPLAAQDPDRAMRQAGALMGASVAGLRALLMARGLVKREFRIEQTVLRPKENNPLKFASSNEHALAALLDPRTEGWRAVQQAVGDLTEHEVAVMSAAQAAARAMLKGLSPASLEAEDSGGGMLPGATEKRLWSTYKRRYATLLAQLEDDFDSAFRTEFARAYEQAVDPGGKP